MSMTNPTLSSIAIQAHHIERMVAFYSEAFGGEFRKVAAGGLESWFGVVAGITLKLVPLRGEADFEQYPLHQLGFAVEAIDEVIAIALKHGGRREGEVIRQGDQAHGAVRDPDGNTLELYSSA